MRALTGPEVWARRLAQHALLVPQPKEEWVEVICAMGGIHAEAHALRRTRHSRVGGWRNAPSLETGFSTSWT